MVINAIKMNVNKKYDNFAKNKFCGLKLDNEKKYQLQWDRCLLKVVRKKCAFDDAGNIYGISVTQVLPYLEYIEKSPSETPLSTKNTMLYLVKL